MSAPLRRSTRIRSGLVGSPGAPSKSSATSNGHAAKFAKVSDPHGNTQSLPTAEATLSQAKAKKARVPQRLVKKDRRPNTDYHADRVQSLWKVGAHVSAAGGVENSILNAASIGANAFALFVKSQRKWMSADLSAESIRIFKARLQEFNYSPKHILPHGSYLINLGNPDEEKREKSYECFLDDLKRCEQLGLALYNFHPGSTVGLATKQESMKYVATCLNRAHKTTSQIVTVIENMAGSGNVLGSTFEEISYIINNVVDKSRIGVCLDTCHMFAAGYDIRSKEAYESTMLEFDRQVGLKYLCGMHINDSKVGLASAKDRHDNIGQGHISLEAFTHIMRDRRLQDIPLILETPTNEDSAVWRKEIEILNSLSTGRSDDADTLAQFTDVIRRVVRRSGGKNGASKVSKTKGKRKRTHKGEEDEESESESEGT